MLTEEQRRRVRNARLDPPIRGRVSGILLLVVGSVGLMWTLAGGVEPSLDAVNRALGVVALGWTGVICLIRGQWEPLVAFLGRRLQELRTRGEAPRGGEPVGALEVLTAAEKRDLVSAQLGSAPGRAKSWILVGWLVLGAGGCFAGFDLWQLLKAEPSSGAVFVVSFSFVLGGAFVAARSRWRPIVAAVREALGEAAFPSTGDGCEATAGRENRAARIAGLTRAEQHAVALALGAVARRKRDPVLRFVPLALLGIALALLAQAAREMGGWQAQRGPLLVIGVALLVVFEGGYLVARDRWQRIVAVLRDARGAQSDEMALEDEDGG